MAIEKLTYLRLVLVNTIDQVFKIRPLAFPWVKGHFETGKLKKIYFNHYYYYYFSDRYNKMQGKLLNQNEVRWNLTVMNIVTLQGTFKYCIITSEWGCVISTC